MIGFDEKTFVFELDCYREKQFLERVKAYDEHVAATMRLKGYHRVDSSERTVLFTFGEITFTRSRWKKDGKTCYPVDEWLGLKKYMRYSPELIFHLARHATVLSYREVCRTIKAAYRIEVTKDAVLKAVKLAGRLFSDRERYRFFLEEEQPQKIQAERIYLEGDGVMIKTTSGGDERRNTDLTHFLIHTGIKQIGSNRYTLENKHEIIHTDYEKARDELLDYLYNHFEITDQTILITNSDNGKGYTKRVFNEIKKALRIKRHEHFWDAYHLNEKLKKYLKPYPATLRDLAFKAVQTHNKSLLVSVFDTVESLIETEEEYERFSAFRYKLIRHFGETKPAKLRGLSPRGIGVMESQHRKITYRMKHRGMYWSIKGAYAMAKMILLERVEQLEMIFLGEWHKQYELFKGMRTGVGRLSDRGDRYRPSIIKRRRQL